MAKLLLMCGFVLLALGCRIDNTENQVAEDPMMEIDVEELPERASPNDRAVEILKTWPEFQAMETAFDGLYAVENDEDLRLVVDDLIEKQNAMEASEYPEAFDKPQIKGRQKALKTYILKVKSTLEYRMDPMEATGEMAIAHNALINQFNVLVNYTLETEFMPDEN